MNITAKSITICALTLGVVIGAAAAPVTTFANLGDYLAGTSGNTLIDFEAQNAGGASSYQYYGGNLTVGSVSFGQPDSRLFVFGQSYYATNGLTSSYLNQNCCAAQGLSISFTNDIYAVAMDYGIQYGWNSSDLSISFTLSTGEVISRTPDAALYGTGKSMDFLGFSSDVAIHSITISDPSQGFSMDNLRFSERAAAVPEPGALALSALALAGLWASRRRANPQA